ncbi:MSHA biogenesis protein MshM [Shewanella denitrificans OS217]|uniref:MSHA biogenesis protein MshM n=1 Tax=Shewanella denitrificans (strain OS217 / ATCC BAA-1090 / DSM 15013) TaxID=318161 RepID=Q12IV4_SHEDO|nr:AAA family ATPase [Shewanella denitrificans]ABE56622.1 MSHA biogenesis protein MshM [Shewanella denitrificans OS217]
MYLAHFGLSQLPFGLTPNTGFFFGLIPHVEALQVLQVALEGGEGFIKVTGEVGTGKTLVCRKLLNSLPKQYQSAYLPNPYLTPDELRWALACELGLKCQTGLDQRQLTHWITKRLLALSLGGKQVVLVVDEAQALPDESLEALRLLTNLESEQRKLIQLVLFGQPELDERLQTHQFRQLRQRISFSYCLRPLMWDEVQAYIQHRLAVAGYQGDALFSDKDIKMLTQASRGIPRLINILAHKCLLLCYSQGEAKVLSRHCIAAIADTQDAQLLPESPVTGWGVGVILALLMVTAVATAQTWGYLL